MIYEKINLYEQFENLKETKSKGGYLTVYAHENTVEINEKRKYPGMLVVHGGGYVGKSFREGEPVALEFFNRGFNCFVLDYDLSPFSYDFSPLIEGALAMKYIRNNTLKYNLTSKVCVCGFSAGGHLTAFLGTAFDDTIYKDFFLGDIDGIRPDGIVVSYGVISNDYLSKSKSLLRVALEDEKIAKRFSLEKRADSRSSPAYIWTTADDESVDPINSLLLAKSYSENKVPYSIHIFRHGAHGLSLATDIVDNKKKEISKSENLNSWIDEATQFLKELNITFED